jgi:hypothetical protein
LRLMRLMLVPFSAAGPYDSARRGGVGLGPRDPVGVVRPPRFLLREK